MGFRRKHWWSGEERVRRVSLGPTPAELVYRKALCGRWMLLVAFDAGWTEHEDAVSCDNCKAALTRKARNT